MKDSAENILPICVLSGYRHRAEEETESCLLTAIKNGYRSIDTAQAYGNEEGVGQAIVKCGLPREDCFPAINAEHISRTGININAVALWIVFCKYCSHRIPSPYYSINH